jgi:hypothetical protein
MDRRSALLSTGVAAVAGLVAANVHADEHAAHANHGSNSMSECLEACQSCEMTCNETLAYCMKHIAEGHKDHAPCAELVLSCQEFCGLSAKLMARSSPLHKVGCQACASACDACATECEKMPADEQMAQCAKACRKCAAECRKMI